MFTLTVWVLVATAILLFFGFGPKLRNRDERLAATCAIWVSLVFCTAMTLVLNER